MCPVFDGPPKQEEKDEAEQKEVLKTHNDIPANTCGDAALAGESVAVFVLMCVRRPWVWIFIYFLGHENHHVCTYRRTHDLYWQGAFQK